ncbi:hypothetical protein [Streptomyces sp. NPDC090798]|uniref:hypothetical protein n=1 Tax=Streptomyces sp. NPDC090798 TaxID=3365968 RepID=UPI0037F1FC1C
MFHPSFLPARRMRRVGTLLAVACVSTLVIAFGEPSDEGPQAAQASADSASVAPSSAAPKPSLSAMPRSVPSTARETAAQTPAQRLDTLGHAKKWDLSGSSASEFTQDACDMAGETDSAPDQAGESVAQALAMRATSAESGAAALRAGIPALCPKWTRTLAASLSGRYDRWITDDTYDIGSKPGQIPAGTYRTAGDLSDCYWERTAVNGDVIDNGWATAARAITVHIRESDSTFTSDNCGVWTPVH